LAANLAESGYVFKERWQPEVSAETIAAAVGPTLSLVGADVVHRLHVKAKAEPNKYSGIYGLGAFPLHTDLAHVRTPPRYLMLRCVRGYGTVSTDLVDGFALVERIGRSVMSNALVKPRRPLNGSTPLYSLYRPASAVRDAMLRWDEVFIVPASPAGVRGFAAMAKELGPIPRIPIPLQFPGDTLWIDNWRMLHGRSPVSADQSDRIIQRAYFGELY
jgi:alpha-ketoglutarate-dependent taurine dioxygenase